jgi:hypothetical protein
MGMAILSAICSRYMQFGWILGTKKPAWAGFAYRAENESGSHGLEFGVQTALVASSLVLVDQAFVSDTVNHRNC